MSQLRTPITPLQRCPGHLRRVDLRHSGAMALVALLAGPVLAQQDANTGTQMPQAPKAPGALTASTPTAPVSSNLSLQPPTFGGRLDLNLQNADGQDDEGDLRRNTGQAEIQLTLEMEQQLGAANRFVAQLQLASLKYSEELLDNDDEEFSYDLERLYYEFKPSPAFRLRAGRQGLDDPMEAIMDENLDGLRINYLSQTGFAEFELSYTREDWFEASTFDREDDITNTMASIQFSSNKNSVWMPYVLQQSEEPFNGSRAVDSTWIGLQGVIEPKDSAWRYWLHGSMLDGEESSARRSTELGGYAIDLGINWTANLPLKPVFTFAAAHATGGDNADRFRQSGLQSNDFALNGKNSFRYLGEVMDPELTNIRILTLGLGLDLAKHWSADIALHTYQQVETEDRLRGSDIEYAPMGVNDDLGTGADLVVAYEPGKQLEIKGTVGVFQPGDAFDADRDDASLALLELEYTFW